MGTRLRTSAHGSLHVELASIHTVCIYFRMQTTWK